MGSELKNHWFCFFSSAYTFSVWRFSCKHYKNSNDPVVPRVVTWTNLGDQVRFQVGDLKTWSPNQVTWKYKRIKISDIKINSHGLVALISKFLKQCLNLWYLFMILRYHCKCEFKSIEWVGTVTRSDVF